MFKVFASDLNAQSISLDISNAKLKRILAEIESKSDYSFFYNSSIVNVDRRASVKVKDASLNDALNLLLANTGIGFSFVRDQIILFPKDNIELKEKIENLLQKNKNPVALTSAKINDLLISSLQQTITGVVVDKDNIPVPGASVIIKNTSTGTATDFDGNFSLEANDNAILIVSYLGYKTLEVPVNGRKELTIRIEEDAAQLEEVVVVGYGTQKKATVTGAVTAVKGAVLESSPAVSVSNALAGRLPGVVIVQTSGEPGNDESNITIRGTNTIGNNSPLVVIDGIPDRDGGISRLNALDIENISVLKDASAAIYGARAANGAIIVTTKQGKKGKVSVTYDADFGYNQPTVIPQMASSVQYADIVNELRIYNNIPSAEWGAASTAIRNTGIYESPNSEAEASAVYSPEDVAGYKAGQDDYLYPNTDWFGDAFKDWALQSRHNLSISGGGENVQFFSSIGYQDQDAYYKNSANRYQQYNFRINTTARINDYISTKLGFAYRKEDRKFPTQSSNAIFRMLMRGRPTEPAIWPTGEPGPDIENGQNPIVIATNATGYDSQPTDYLQITASVDIEIPWVKGLKATLLTGVDQSNARRKLWETPWSLYSLNRADYIATGNPVLTENVKSPFTDARLTQSSTNILNINLTGLLSYDTTFGDHTIGALVGVTNETFKGENFLAYRQNFISPTVDQLFAGGKEGQITDGRGYNRTRLGYYGRLQYNYKEKYLAEFIGRYDGSYIFSKDNRFGFFPGFLAGWNITNEEWFNVKGIDLLKLRGSYGQMGNDQVAFDSNNDGQIDADELQEYAYLSTYNLGEYPIGTGVATTLEESLLANPNFTWERANNLNVGLDGIILNSSLSFTLEYFLNKRNKILIQETGSTPASSGINSLLPPVNLGEVKNSGYEFSLTYYGGKQDGFNYDFGVNGGYAQSEVVNWDDNPGDPQYQLKQGKAIFGHLVYISDGAFKDQAEIDANTLDYSQLTGTLKPGDMKFKDINNDGKIDADDQKRLDESINPTFNFGITFNAEYKNFDFSLLFQGATGASVPIQTESGEIGNFLEYSYENRWSIDNPSSVHPRLANRGDTYYTGGNFGNNTYFLFDKDYIRLKNIKLAYNFPSKFIQPLGLSKFQVYVNALNLFTFAKSDIYDPESNSGDGRIYPQARVINTGFSLTF
ncbi:SusC/RagA family TonB-linked outer membrane protein [Zobellia sp. OII3]|uniref:SusC/RagA family TonB-linked outer membrane protein n=1 Tax=Zobellia sp. OII3 TaxID=2034520 RepID=UPI00137478E0|nr:TonB-dependent receptor [Zobellia sp. OII3]